MGRAPDAGHMNTNNELSSAPALVQRFSFATFKSMQEQVIYERFQFKFMRCNDLGNSRTLVTIILSSVL